MLRGIHLMVLAGLPFNLRVTSQGDLTGRPVPKPKKRTSNRLFWLRHCSILSLAMILVRLFQWQTDVSYPGKCRERWLESYSIQREVQMWRCPESEQSPNTINHDESHQGLFAKSCHDSDQRSESAARGSEISQAFSASNDDLPPLLLLTIPWSRRCILHVLDPVFLQQGKIRGRINQSRSTRICRYGILKLMAKDGFDVGVLWNSLMSAA